jgi:hypothetical protein
MPIHRLLENHAFGPDDGLDQRRLSFPLAVTAESLAPRRATIASSRPQ